MQPPHCNPCNPARWAPCCGPGFLAKWWHWCDTYQFNVKWQHLISDSAPEPVGGGGGTSASALCLTSYVQTKTDLKCHFKYHGICLTYQMAICLTKMPLLPLRYLSYKCWFSLIKIPDCRPCANRVSSDLLADIWIVKLCQQPHLSNCLFKTEYAVCSVQKKK